MNYERKIIYLSGPIMDECLGTAREWRELAKELLQQNFDTLDPMRRKFVDRQVDSSNEIVEFDLQDVRDADIVLVNYNKPSIGTSMEVFYAAHDLGKFVVAFSPFTFVECSPWMVKYCTKILGTLEDACHYISNHFCEDKFNHRCRRQVVQASAYKHISS
jgi:nucleoside 2-deoxyribosyltransferase